MSFDDDDRGAAQRLHEIALATVYAPIIADDLVGMEFAAAWRKSVILDPRVQAGLALLTLEYPFPEFRELFRTGALESVEHRPNHNPVILGASWRVDFEEEELRRDLERVASRGDYNATLWIPKSIPFVSHVITDRHRALIDLIRERKVIVPDVSLVPGARFSVTLKGGAKLYLPASQKVKPMSVVPGRSVVAHAEVDQMASSIQQTAERLNAIEAMLVARTSDANVMREAKPSSSTRPAGKRGGSISKLNGSSARAVTRIALRSPSRPKKRTPASDARISALKKHGITSPAKLKAALEERGHEIFASVIGEDVHGPNVTPHQIDAIRTWFKRVERRHFAT
jgi:hypothetical protein